MQMCVRFCASLDLRCSRLCWCCAYWPPPSCACTAGCVVRAGKWLASIPIHKLASAGARTCEPERWRCTLQLGQSSISTAQGRCESPPEPYASAPQHHCAAVDMAILSTFTVVPLQRQASLPQEVRGVLQTRSAVERAMRSAWACLHEGRHCSVACIAEARHATLQSIQHRTLSCRHRLESRGGPQLRQIAPSCSARRLARGRRRHSLSRRPHGNLSGRLGSTWKVRPAACCRRRRCWRGQLDPASSASALHVAGLCWPRYGRPA